MWLQLYLGSIDESPCIKQAETVLVAVMEAGSVYPPVYTVVTLLKTKHTHTHSKVNICSYAGIEIHKQYRICFVRQIRYNVLMSF